jgi:hypothetical protein
MKYAGIALAALVVLGSAGCSQNFFHGQKDPPVIDPESLLPPAQQSELNQLNRLWTNPVNPPNATVVLRPDFNPSVYQYAIYAYNSNDAGNINITITPGTHATSKIFLSTDEGSHYTQVRSLDPILVANIGRWEIKTLTLMVRPEDPLVLPCAYTITVYGAPEWEYQATAQGVNPLQGG